MLGDKQMELYRALKYTDDRARHDRSRDGERRHDLPVRPREQGQSGRLLRRREPADAADDDLRDADAAVQHRQTVNGPDQRSYRVDTYIVSQTPPTGRAVKLVTIVVRRGSDLRQLARVSSSFDQSSGL